MTEVNKTVKVRVSPFTFNKSNGLFNLSISIEDESLLGFYSVVKFINNQIVVLLVKDKTLFSNRYTATPIRLRKKTKGSNIVYFGMSKKTVLSAMREWGCNKWVCGSLKTTGVYADGKIMIEIGNAETMSLDDISRSFNLFTPGNLSPNSKGSFASVDDDGNPVYVMPEKDTFYRLEREIVAPERATELLNLNIKNRDASQNNLRKVIHAIMSGEWDVNNGETIKINTNSEIVDGQHRLMAIVHTGIAIPLTIAFGVSENAQETIDTGRSRNGADILSIEGFQVPKKAAGVLNKLAFLNGETVAAEYKAKCSTTWLNADLVVYASENKDDLDKAFSLFNGMVYSNNSVCRKYISLSLGIIFMRISEEKATEFMTGVFSGYNLKEGSPAAELRLKLITAEKKRASNPRNRIDDHDIALWFIKAWNAFVSGKTIRQSNFKLNRSESLPEILGITS